MIDVFSNKFLPAFYSLVMKGESPEALYDGILALQELLSHANPFLGGDKLNIADIAIAPFVARLDAQLRNDVGAYAEGEGPKVHNEIFKHERFGPFQKYAKTLLERNTVKESFPEVSE